MTEQQRQNPPGLDLLISILDGSYVSVEDAQQGEGFRSSGCEDFSNSGQRPRVRGNNGGGPLLIPQE